jgi:DNA primase
MSAADEIKARLDIVDVVGSYVTLRKAGRQFKAVCPFHTEKTPSFIVSPDRQTWHCFGACSTGGDIFTFVQKKENTDFNGALRLLADRAGVELERESSRRDELQPLFDANEAAAIYYHSLLLGGSSPGLAYAESRGIDRQAMSDFQIGFAPAGWENLREHLTSRGFSDAQLVEAGLLVESERSGRAYDRFRGRLMFPIRDERGRVVGFGGRVLPGSETEGAKYINTPQTPVFDKGGLLYALHRARDQIRGTATAVVVEGYMDVVTAHQFGFRNVVASMGTALTERQVSAIERLRPRRAIFAMDSDAAGSAAAVRDAQVAIAAGRREGRPVATSRGIRTAPNLAVDWLVAALPEGVDPDDLIRRDAAGWESLIDASKPVVDHLIAVVTAGLDLAQPRDRATLVSEVLPAIGDIADPVVRAHYLQRLARLARISEDGLRAQLSPVRGRRPSRAAASPPGSAAEVAGPSPAPVQETRSPREEFCLALLYGHPELKGRSDVLNEGLFFQSENRELYRRWDAGEDTFEGEPVLGEHLQRIMSLQLPVNDTETIKAAFIDCVARLEQARMKAVKEASSLALAEGEASLSIAHDVVRPGEAVAIARARWEAGTQQQEAPDESPDEQVASQLLQDMEAGLRFHRRFIDAPKGNQGEGPSK